MDRIQNPKKMNPKKLLLSKWTAINPKQKERHFMVTKLIKDDDEKVVACQLQAVINKNDYEIMWQDLKDNSKWLMGWK